MVKEKTDAKMKDKEDLKQKIDMLLGPATGSKSHGKRDKSRPKSPKKPNRSSPKKHVPRRERDRKLAKRFMDIEDEDSDIEEPVGRPSVNMPLDNTIKRSS